MCFLSRISVQASIQSNLYVVSGEAQNKSTPHPCRFLSILPATCTHRHRHTLSVFSFRRLVLFLIILVCAELEELLPGIIGQLGPEGMETLRKLAGSLGAGAAAGGDDDDVPELVENFDGSK
jgi:hypothetical protein